MGMWWRGDVPIDRTGGVVLEFGGNKLARGLGWMIAADPRLRVAFKLVKGDADAFPVRFADAFIATDKRRQRDGLGRGESRVPTGPVFHRFNGLAVGVLIYIRRSLPYQLFVGLRMLSLAEFGKILGGDGPGKTELRGQAALPRARNHAALRPIVLLLGGELLLVISLRLACGKRFGDSQHGLNPRAKVQVGLTFLLCLTGGLHHRTLPVLFIACGLRFGAGRGI